jgi:hypothetical protein
VGTACFGTVTVTQAVANHHDVTVLLRLQRCRIQDRVGSRSGVSAAGVTGAAAGSAGKSAIAMAPTAAIAQATQSALP